MDDGDTGDKKLFSQWSTPFTFVTKLFPKSVLLYLRCPRSGGVCCSPSPAPLPPHWSLIHLPTSNLLSAWQPQWALQCGTYATVQRRTYHWILIDLQEGIQSVLNSDTIQSESKTSSGTQQALRNVYFLCPSLSRPVGAQWSVSNGFLLSFIQNPPFHRVPILSPASGTVSSFGRGHLWNPRGTGSLLLERSQKLNLWSSQPPRRALFREFEKLMMISYKSYN